MKTILKILKPRRLVAFNKHTLIFGKSGSGKSMLAEYILENHYGKGYKILDAYDEGRCENATWCLPSNKRKFIEQLKNLTGEKPRSYPNDIYMVCGPGLQYTNSFPKNFKIVSFDEKDLDMSDLFYLFGNNKGAQAAVSQISFLFGNNLSLKDFGDIISLGEFRGRRFNPKWLDISPMTKGMILRNLIRLKTSGLFSNKCEKIDLLSILDDMENITSISTMLVDAGMKNVVYGILFKKILEYKKSKLVKAPLIVYFREVAVLMNPDWKFSYYWFGQLLRQGRDILAGENGKAGFVLVDTQNLNDIEDKIVDQFGYYYVLRSNRSAAMRLLKIQDIPQHIINLVSNFRLGQGIITTGSQWIYNAQCPSTRHYHKNRGDDVIKMLGKVYGMKEYNFKELMENEKPIGLQKIEEELGISQEE